MTAEPALELAPMRVAVDAGRAAAYARETGFAGAPDVAPLAYPAVWLTAPQIHDALERICAEAKSVPVHEQQRFLYEAPLQLGAAYDLHVVLRREEKPARLVIEARVETPAGALVGRVEARLRLVSKSRLGKGEDA